MFNGTNSHLPAEASAQEGSVFRQSVDKQNKKYYTLIMKKIITTILVFSAFLTAASGTKAQMMGRFSNTAVDWQEVVEHTLREEKEGKELWNKFQTKETACAELTNEQFGVLGEYFMGQMMGSSHSAMNQMMINMMGEDGEEQMHLVMGKRLSGCDTTAVFPAQGIGFMPMMQMMMGGWSSPFGFNQANNSMMNFGFTPFSWFGWLFMLLWWALIIIIVIASVKWLAGQFKGGTANKNALDILKERYAKGEIDKREFEEKQKDL